MIEEVFPKIKCLKIPLPDNPLRAINSYVIEGGERFLMVDTGMNRPECMEAMQSGLKELKVDLERTDFFITHIHADHLGLASALATDSSIIYFNRPDAQIFRDPDNWDKMSKVARVNGFPESEREDALSKHPGRRYQSRRDVELTLLEEGDTIQVGSFSWQCVETPGHTRGHLCLYEPEAKILFSGDHILETITSNLALWSEDGDPLNQYLESLDKMNRYEVDYVLPGHRKPFNNHRRRIAELKQHHKVRAEEVMSLLKQGKQNAYQVASHMTWDIDCELWEDFPVSQKWFATGEALSHLQYLLGKGLVKRELRNHKAFYSVQ